MTIINRVYNADDLLNTTMNPVTVSVTTDSTDPDTVILSFVRNNNTANPSICTSCVYKFSKADITHLYDFLGDAINWLNYEDEQNPTPTPPTPPVVPVPPGQSDCEKDPSCNTCPSSNVPTPPLGPYDPDFWPTFR